ncbi:hypothetical protein [Clostridium sp. VAP51]|uniref:hypothetical protein n=1 Tax=Clostridium sp. VAP51 TaxID=2949978 RepID=UPI0020792564|nr:hypothetical protein [Clostridium sp. VAP51]
MDDNTKNIVTLCISGYAALISTITLLWNIINSILSKISKLNVQISFFDIIIANGEMQPIKGPRNMNISIVNKSSKNKYVQSINIRLPYKTKFGSCCGLYKDNIKFPVLIKPEEEIVFKYKINPSAEWMFENYKEGRFNIFIIDTTRKKYKSKKSNVSNLKAAYDFNCKIPIETWNIIKGSDL